MKSYFVTSLLFLTVLAQLSFASQDIKSIDTNTLIQQAKELRVSTREQFKTVGRRLNVTQVMNISGSYSGLFSRGHIQGQGYELLKETEWYYIETMNPVDIESVEARLKNLVQEYKSTVTGSFSIPSRRIQSCTLEAIELIKIKKANSLTTASGRAKAKSMISSFSRIMQELEVRVLNSQQKESVSELAKWGTTTVIVERNFNISSIELRDDYDAVMSVVNGGYLVLNGYSYQRCQDPTLEALSTVKATVLY